MPRSFPRRVGRWIGIIAAAGCAAAGLRATDGGDAPLFRFVQFSDCHVTEAPGDRYRLAVEKFESATKDISRARWAPRPDFILATGDIAHASVPQYLERDNELAARLLQTLPAPVMMVAGNHEIFQGEGDDFLQAPFFRHFGYGMGTYGVIYKGVLFVMVNDSGGYAGGNPTADQRNAAVADLLARYPEMPKIVACHIPLVPLREEGVLKQSFGMSTYKLVGDGGLLSIIEKHSDTVIAVLCGHLHLTGHVVRNGIHHFCVSGTASFPSHYAEFAVYPDRVRVQVRQPAANLLKKFDGMVHDRKGIAYVDAAHPTHEAYVSGTAEEQAFEIPLTGAKRIPQVTDSLLVTNVQGFVAPNTQAVRLPSGAVQVRNFGPHDSVVRIPLAAPASGARAVSADRQALYLNEKVEQVWSAEALRRGVPVLLKAGDSVALEAIGQAAPADCRMIDTEALIGWDRQRLAGLTRMRVGMKYWSDRDYLIDRLPEELVGLERVSMRCRQRELVLTRSKPGKLYAAFLPFQGTTAKPEELAALGWQLYRAEAFNGAPYPRNQTNKDYDIYVHALSVGENRLADPRADSVCTWVVLGIEDGQ